MAKQGTSEDVSSKLEAALAEETPAESATAEEEEASKAKGSGETEKQHPDSIPYPRFKEVNDARKEIEERVSTLEDQLREKDSAVSRLTELLEASKEDVDIINQIRSWANDPKLGPHIQILDKAVREGLDAIEEEVEEGKTTPEQAQAKTQKLLEDRTARLQEAIEDQEADLVLSRADIIADKLLDALPEEYTEQDKQIIARLWADEVDWSHVAENPDDLSSTLHTGFQAALENFGTPRGGLVYSGEVETEETVEEPPSPEEEIRSLIDKPWAAMKEVNKGNKTVLVPEHDDADFSAAMATAMRKARGAS